MFPDWHLFFVFGMTDSPIHSHMFEMFWFENSQVFGTIYWGFGSLFGQRHWLCISPFDGDLIGKQTCETGVLWTLLMEEINLTTWDA